MVEKINIPIDKKTEEDMIRRLYPYDGNESCGILGSRDGHTITDWAFDTAAKKYADANYCKIDESMSDVVSAWNRNGIAFIGIVHNHPENRERLSFSDRLYAESIIRCNKLHSMIMAIVAGQKIVFYTVNIDNTVKNDKNNVTIDNYIAYMIK